MEELSSAIFCYVLPSLPMLLVISAMLGLWDDRDRASSEVKTIALLHAEDLARKAAALEAMR